MIVQRFKPLASNITVLPGFRARVINLYGETTVVSFIRHGSRFFGTVPGDALGTWQCFHGKACEFILIETGTITELERNQWDHPWL